MAKFGSDVTGMSQADTGAAGRIFEGVVDKSAALGTAATTGLIESAGKMGIDAYHGYQLSEVEQKNLAVVKEAETGILAKSIFKLPLAEEELDPVLKAYGLSTKKYTNALMQGVMTPAEFETRTMENLRRAVNKNPGMRDELVRHTRETLELTGMASALKREAMNKESIEKAQDDYIKQIDAGLSKENIFLPNTTPVYEKERVLIEATKDTKAFEIWKRANEHKEKFTTEQATVWVEGNGFNAVRGGITEWNKTILSLGTTSEGKPETFANVIANVKLQAPIQKELFANSIPAELRQQPAVKEKIEAYNKAIDDSISILEKLGSGEDWKKAVSNRLEITKSMQEQSIHNRFNVPLIELATKMAAADPNHFALSPAFREATTAVGLELLSGGYGSPIVDKALPKNMNDTNLSKFIDSAAKVGKEDGNYEGLNKILDSYNKKTATITDPNQKYIFLSKNIESLSKVDLEGADANTVTQVKTMVNNFLSDPQYGLKGMFSNMEKYGATIDILDDGRAMFIKDNAQVFNEKYGTSLNNALKAYANAQNITTKEAATKFYPEYFDKYVNKFITEEKKETVQPKTETTTIKPKTESIPTNQELYGSSVEDIKDWATRIGKTTSSVDEAVFGAWRELVTEGLMTEKQFRTKLRSRFGIKEKE